MKNILKAKSRNAALPDIPLPSLALDGKHYGHAGFPEATDSLAYDAEQRLLAVGTSDGRIKIIGQPGVEALLVGKDSSKTKQLLFLSGKGGLLRVTQEGDLQLWSIQDLSLLDSLPCADPVLAIAQVPDSPFLCLGCESGALQFVQLNAKEGDAASGICEARALELLPYELHADELEVAGKLLCLSALQYGETQRLLGLHEESGAIIWDIRHQRSVVNMTQATSADGSLGSQQTVKSALTAAGPARSACWIGRQGLSFATGHEMGSVLVWVVPPDASGEPPPSPLGPELIMKIDISAGHELAMPVKRLVYMEGACLGGGSSLLVFGGQALDQPDTLSLVSLDGSERDGQAKVHPLPWYGNIRGFAVVPQKGAVVSDADPAAILVLMEGGQVVLFDLPDLRPVPFSLPFQELPDLTVSRLVASASDGSADLLEAHAVTLERLRAARKQERASEASGTRTTDKWRWVFNGGKPGRPAAAPAEVSDLIFTGHKDGRVRIWDATLAVPELVTTVPFDSGGAGPKLRPVSAIEVDVASGLLVVAHEQGEVRIYQYSSSPCNAVSLELDSTKQRPQPEEESGRRQPAGFQRVLRISHHNATVRAVAIAAADAVLLCGDEAGMVSSCNLLEPRLLWAQKLCSQPISSMAVVPQSVSARLSAERQHGAGGAEGSSFVLAVVVLSAGGEFAAFTAATGSALGPKVAPKKPAKVLSLTLLDSEGNLVAPPPAPLDLVWAGNTKTPAATLDGGDFEPPSSVFTTRGSQKSLLSSPVSAAASQASPDADPFHLKPHLDAAGPTPRGSSELPDALEVSKHDSTDEDAFLAAAAQEAESAREHHGKKHRLKSFFKGDAANLRKLLDPREHGKNGGKDSTPGGSFVRRWSQKSVDDSAGASNVSPSGSKGTAEAFSEGKQMSFRSQAASQQSASSWGGEASAAYVLVSTSAFLRLYPIECLQTGDQTTIRKATLEDAISFAAPFSTGQGAGLACISAAGTLKVLSLPALDPVCQNRLSDILGYSWTWSAEPAMADSLQRLCSLGADGQLLLAGVGWEIARLALAELRWRPAACSELYDWDLAHAASAALQRREAAPAEPVEEVQQHPNSREGLIPGISDHKRGLGGFFTHVREGVVNVSSLVDVTGREIGKNIGSLGSAIAGKKEGASGASSSEPPPALDRVLSATSKQRRKPQKAEAAARPSTESREASAREELFGGREPQGGAAKPGLRSADEIRMAYGRSVSRRSETAGAIAAENRAKLAERGERLQHMDTKAEKLAQDAEGFASMARKIRDREANKKWWQI